MRSIRSCNRRKVRLMPIKLLGRRKINRFIREFCKNPEQIIRLRRFK